jgi:photosystem II stability/assembly factor-like uncharacterized protein
MTLLAVMWTGSAWVASGYGRTLLVSDDNGVTWTEVEFPNLGGRTPWGFARHSSGLIAVGDAGLVLDGSLNGRVWSLRYSATGQLLRSVAVGHDDQIVAVGEDGVIVSSTPQD